MDYILKVKPTQASILFMLISTIVGCFGLVFLLKRELFFTLDLFRLTIISSCIAAPIIIIHCFAQMVVYLINYKSTSMVTADESHLGIIDKGLIGSAIYVYYNLTWLFYFKPDFAGSIHQLFLNIILLPLLPILLNGIYYKIGTWWLKVKNKKSPDQ